MEHGSPWLITSLVFLGAAVLAVPLSRLLGLGAIIDYLAAGIAIGPWRLALVTDTVTILHFANLQGKSAGATPVRAPGSHW